MIQYLKAEFGLCRKNRTNFIIGACLLFVYCLLLLFSGIGGVKYAASISLVGFVVVMFFLIPWFFSPASFFQNRKKICVSTEHMALMLGESKRTFVKTKIVICVLHCVFIVCVIALMQIPACLIAGEKYSLWVFSTAVTAVVGFSLLCMVILFLCPSHRLAIAFPTWSGFCGGIIGGILGDMQDFSDVKEVVNLFEGIAVIGGGAFLMAVLYRYIKTVCEERRGLPEKQTAGEE